MNVINIKDYNLNLGELISLDSDYIIKNSRYINSTILIDNPSKYLDKNKTYYIYCKNGIKSRRTVEILKVYGYKVVKVTI